MSATTAFDARSGASNQIALPVIVKQAFFLLLRHRSQVRARNRLRWTLSQQSDRALAGMGLSRADIEDVVRARHPG